MNLFAYSSITLVITNVFLGVFVLLKSSNKRIGIFWCFFCLMSALWGLGGYKFSLSTSKDLAFFWWQVAFIGVIFVPVAFFHFLCVFFKSNNKHILFVSYCFASTCILVDIFARKYFLGDLRFVFNQFYWIDYWFKYKNLLFLFCYIGFYWILLGYAFVVLLRRYKISKDSDRNQLKLFILGSVVAWIGAEFMFLPALGVDIYPSANFLIAIYPLIFTYAIFKHQLMDINIVIRKGLVYSILITVFTIIYLSIVILAEKIFQGIFGYRSILISILFASIIALIFIPLKNKIQSFIDKIFLGKTPAQIAQENELLKQELMRSEKLKTVAAFASGMAHEIKNPLTVIKTFTEFLPQKTEDKEFLKNFSQFVGVEVNRIDDLVHQLLDFSKPQPLQLKETDIHKLIDDTLDILSNQFIKYHIKVSKDYKFNSNNSKINLDSQRIRQVFMNLFINAIEAMPHGGEIFVETNQQNNQLIISIQDTGCGISEKDLPHIFEPFYSTKEKGSGLGLSIVYNIIKEHKGRISVDSKINQGTKFIIGLLKA